MEGVVAIFAISVLFGGLAFLLLAAVYAVEAVVIICWGAYRLLRWALA